MRRIKHNSFRALAMAAVIAGLAVAGCSTGASSPPGANGPSVASLISSMKAGFASAKSVRMSGTLTEQGRTVTLNLGMLRSGDMSGTLSVGSTHLTIVVAGGKAYELVTKAFFKTIQQQSHVPSSVCALMCGKYLAVPISSFSTFNLPGMTGQIEKKIPVAKAVGSVRDTSYGGEPAYELVGSNGTKLYLARNGTHYLLGMTVGTFGTLNFSDWNKVPPVTPPPASQVYNLP